MYIDTLVLQDLVSLQGEVMKTTEVELGRQGLWAVSKGTGIWRKTMHLLSMLHWDKGPGSNQGAGWCLGQLSVPQGAGQDLKTAAHPGRHPHNVRKTLKPAGGHARRSRHSLTSTSHSPNPMAAHEKANEKGKSTFALSVCARMPRWHLLSMLVTGKASFNELIFPSGCHFCLPSTTCFNSSRWWQPNVAKTGSS